ncbi:MAG TPA: amino acid permease [Pyrinomonadaceae bacterium]|nr:amino acid permease [Pyrinomonadaceae bacterium]
MDSNSNNRHDLIRGLGLAAAASVIIGNVIGTGVFLKARVMTCNVGEPFWVIAAWVAAGLLSLAGALTYAELTAMKPHAGGPYVFLRDAFGRIWSFLFGWTQLLIIRTGSQAAVAVVFAIALNDYLDGGLKQTLFETSIAGIPWTVTSLEVIAIMMIAIFTTLNCLSVSVSGQIATILTLVKIGLVIFVGFGAFVWVTGGSFDHFSMASTGGTCEGVAESVRFGSVEYTFLAGFAAAMLGALWGYDGWDNLSFVAGEVKDPGRNLPIAIIGSVLLIILLYVIAQVAYFYVLDPVAVASVSETGSVGMAVVSKFFGGDPATFATGVAVAIFTMGLMLSSLGTLHTSILSNSRIPYAMAQDGVMFKFFGKLSVNSVPVNAVIFQGIWATILALSGSFDTLTDYVIFASWIFYAMVTLSIFVFRRTEPDAVRPYRAWGYPVIPVIFLLVTGWLLINTLMTAPTQSFIGIGLILLGLPVYYYLTRNTGSNGDGEAGSDVTD